MLSAPLPRNRSAVDEDVFTGMKVTTLPPGENRLRLLVAIASFGEKNLDFLKRIIRIYQSLPMVVDVVVFSNRPKDLGSDVKVMVGLPSRNPWSLPFAHKAYFAQHIEQYDLFIYSEDDMEVTEKNLCAFLRITPELAPDEIAGFMRYETDGSGNCSLPEVHGPFHWNPESVKRRGAYTIAEFTNEHAAFYLLTRDQLRKAIASGGFLRKPCRGRYDMLCTAATDPYTNCGFRKVICISALEDFLIHHLSNRYTGEFGVLLSAFKDQVGTLKEIADHTHPAITLDGKESGVPDDAWPKTYFEHPSEEMMRLVPRDVKTILSIGCGSGATEARLRQRGAKVTAVPLDSVVGAAAARRGMEVVYGTFEDCLQALRHRTFDCVYISNILHLPSKTPNLLEECFQMVAKQGTLVICGPNFSRAPLWLRRVLGRGQYRNACNGEPDRVRFCNPTALMRCTESAGFRPVSVRWLHHAPLRWRFLAIRRSWGKITAEDWALQARRDS